MDGLDALHSQVACCTGCCLSETRTNAVPGRGSKDADVVFVGEAPGRSEDLQGRPFVGAAGKILSEALEQSGMQEDSVYITNVVKCRPPGNRQPSSIERESCAQYLQREIQIIKPKIVCIMGNTALGSVLGHAEITKHRGKVARRDGQLYYITIHPAATIYRQELSGVLKSDMKKLRRIIAELKNGRAIQVDIDIA